ncbi:MAG: zinc ribbon domain-containing protein [Anaerolineae bacterium]|nr:zinc ribbon domain-containing protein [Anaerolineae bacterium]
MPLYEYICKDCSHHIEIFRSIKDADLPLQCEQCHGKNVVRQISKFFAQSSGRTLTSAGGGCAGCSGGSCSSCGH